MAWIDNQIANLDVINMMAAKAAGAGIKYVDTYDVLNGHEICNTAHAAEWMNRSFMSTDPLVVNQSFHPNVAGHQHEADFVMSRM